MASYGFYFRPSTRRGGGPGKLYLRVVQGGESRSVTTTYKLWEDEWNPMGRMIIHPRGRTERGRELAEIENSMTSDLRRMEMVTSELDRSGDYTADELMDRYRSVMSDNTLASFAQRLARKLDVSGVRRTAQAYRGAATRLIAFNGGRDLHLDRLSAPMISEFQQALKAEGCKPNTVSFYMRTLRAIYHKAIAEGRTSKRADNIFAGVYTGVAATRKLALSGDELALLAAHDPTIVRNRTRKEETLPRNLAPALAMFLFCYHARGMSFVDAAHLKKSDVRGETMSYRRQKTGQRIELLVLPAMRRIIDWFGSQTAGSRYLFPVITNPHKNHRLQYESGLRLQNQRLKKVAMLCGVGKLISTHCARHSWATVAKSAGLPLAVISEGLGHTNQRTTEIYLASLSRSVIDHASKVVSEAIILAGYLPKRGRRVSAGCGEPLGYGQFGGGYGYAVGYR
jgi:integrase